MNYAEDAGESFGRRVKTPWGEADDGTDDSEPGHIRWNQTAMISKRIREILCLSLRYTEKLFFT